MKRFLLLVITIILSIPAYAQFEGITYQSIESNSYNNSYNNSGTYNYGTYNNSYNNRRSSAQVYTTTGYFIDNNGSISNMRIRVQVSNSGLKMVAYYRQSSIGGMSQWVNCNGTTTPMYSAQTSPGSGSGNQKTLESNFMYKITDASNLSRKIYFDL